MSEMRRLSEVNGTTDSTNSSGNATIVVTGDDNSTHIVLVDPVTNATFFLNETFTNHRQRNEHDDRGGRERGRQNHPRGEGAIRQAAQHDRRAHSVVGMSLTNGEEPKSLLSPDLSMRVGKKDGCALEDQPFEAPSAGASSGGFQLPQGTTCNRPERRRKLRIFRRRRPRPLRQRRRPRSRRPSRPSTSTRTALPLRRTLQRASRRSFSRRVAPRRRSTSRSRSPS